MPTLTVLTVSTLPAYGWRFIRDARDLAQDLGAEYVLAVDLGGMPAERAESMRGLGESRGPNTRTVFVDSQGKGYLEACLNQALDQCDSEYVLRLDDDERATPILAKWLREWVRCCRPEKQYTFARAALYPDADHYVAQQPWWPDPQARLATRELSRRSYLHELWHGGEVYVPNPIEHHVYLVKTAAEHDAIRAIYATARPDAPYPMPNEQTKVVAM